MANQSEECNKWSQLDRTRIRNELVQFDLFERRSGVVEKIISLIVAEKEHSFRCGFQKAMDKGYRKPAQTLNPTEDEVEN